MVEEEPVRIREDLLISMAGGASGTWSSSWMMKEWEEVWVDHLESLNMLVVVIVVVAVVVVVVVMVEETVQISPHGLMVIRGLCIIGGDTRSCWIRWRDGGGGRGMKEAYYHRQ